MISFNLFPLNYLFICITYVKRGNGSAVNVPLERYKFLALSQPEPKIFSISGSFAIPSCTNIVKTDVLIINKLIRCLIIYGMLTRDTRNFLSYNEVWEK